MDIVGKSPPRSAMMVAMKREPWLLMGIIIGAVVGFIFLGPQLLPRRPNLLIDYFPMWCAIGGATVGLAVDLAVRFFGKNPPEPH